MNRKLLCALIALILFICAVQLSSCRETTDDDRPYVIGTVFPQYDFTREIGGDLVRCEMLLPPGQDSHSFTGDDPSDIYRIMKCDLFIYVGGETDSEWVERIKQKIEDGGEGGPVFLSLCEVCDTLEESNAGIVEGEENEEEEDEEFDEHVWTSPLNAIKAAGAICEALCIIDPGNSEEYRTRCDDYTAKLAKLDSAFKNTVQNAELKTLVFADRFPFRYFAEEYGLECFAAFNGCASQAEPSPTTVIKLCEKVEELSLPYVIYIETSNSSVPDMICENTGCGKLLLHSCHTVTQRELDDGVSYLTLMENNLENLRKALNK